MVDLRKNAEPRYYAAYGSDLHLSRMSQRCPTARLVGSDVLSDWQLRFRGTPGNAVATIERVKDHTVPVLIYALEPEDELALDGFEGWPQLYRKEDVEVRVDGRTVTAFTYIMNEVNHPYNQPGGYYYNVILAGYLLNDFEVGILQEAVSDNPR